jgi:hypothetical protein
MGNFHKLGAVGHLVLTSRRYQYTSSAYHGDYNGAFELGFMTRRKPTPCLTREQYESHGIIYSHGSLLDAIKAANSGDRIYLAPGVHKREKEKYRSTHEKILVMKDLEFIGLGEAEDIVVEIDYRENNCFEVTSEQVGFYNLTFKAMYDRANLISEENDKRMSDTPFYAHGSADHAIISFEEPTEYQKPLKASYCIKNCNFEMGAGNDTFPTRISGVFLKRGATATIEDCQFIGGSGSALVVVNDPYLHMLRTEINHNLFMNNGQPTFVEKTLRSGEITPGPASVELYKIDRYLYHIRGMGSESEKEVVVSMNDNTFTSNLRAPFACRVIHPKGDTILTGTRSSENSWKVRSDVADNDSTLLHGFAITLNNNSMDNNCLQLQLQADADMKIVNTSSPQKKKTKSTYPDENSMLVIHHHMSILDSHTFPANWEEANSFFPFQ